METGQIVDPPCLRQLKTELRRRLKWKVWPFRVFVTVDVQNRNTYCMPGEAILGATDVLVDECHKCVNELSTNAQRLEMVLIKNE